MAGNSNGRTRLNSPPQGGRKKKSFASCRRFFPLSISCWHLNLSFEIIKKKKFRFTETSRCSQTGQVSRKEAGPAGCPRKEILRWTRQDAIQRVSVVLGLVVVREGGRDLGEAGRPTDPGGSDLDRDRGRGREVWERRIGCPHTNVGHWRGLLPPRD